METIRIKVLDGEAFLVLLSKETITNITFINSHRLQEENQTVIILIEDSEHRKNRRPLRESEFNS